MATEMEIASLRARLDRVRRLLTPKEAETILRQHELDTETTRDSEVDSAVAYAKACSHCFCFMRIIDRCGPFCTAEIRCVTLE